MGRKKQRTKRWLDLETRNKCSLPRVVATLLKVGLLVRFLVRDLSLTSLLGEFPSIFGTFSVDIEQRVLIAKYRPESNFNANQYNCG